MNDTNTVKEENLNHNNQYLLCSYADMYYGIPLHIVQEVVETSKEYELPIPNNNITGLINVRNSVFGLISPNKLFTKIKHNTNKQGKSPVILCNINDIEFGIKVDNVYEVIYIDSKELHDISSTSPQTTSSCAKYLYETKDKIITCIDEKNLLNNILNQSA